MFLPIIDIPEDGLSTQFMTDVQVLDSEEIIPVSVHVSILKKRETIFIEGNLQASVRLTCSRCLRDYTRDFDTSFNVRYVPLERKAPEKEHELTKDELDIAYYSEGIINLKELATEQLILMLPMKPLCKDECKGLCMICGIDLNESHCACHVDKTDPRWAALKKLQKGVINA